MSKKEIAEIFNLEGFKAENYDRLMKLLDEIGLVLGSGLSDEIQIKNIKVIYISNLNDLKERLVKLECLLKNKP